MHIFRFFKGCPRLLNKFLSYRFWNGLGALAMICIAILLFIIGQQWERERYEETLANIQLSDVDIIKPIEEIISENETYVGIKIVERAPNITSEEYEPAQGNRWLAVLRFVNKGPAPAGKFIIRIVYGGEGIEPVGMPRMASREISGQITRGGTTYTTTENGLNVYETVSEIMVDSLFINSDVYVVMEFSAEREIDTALRNDPTYRYCSWSFCDTKIEGYTISDLESYLNKDYAKFKNYPRFIREINIRGQYVKQTWEWQYHTLLFGKR